MRPYQLPLRRRGATVLNKLHRLIVDYNAKRVLASESEDMENI